MIRIFLLRFSLVFTAVLVGGMPPETRGEEGTTVDKSITDARAALRHRHYSRAVRTLEEALKNSPGDSRLRIELGRAYVYQRRDAQAVEIFRAVLRDDPADREAKLELARALSYQGKY